MDSGMDAACRYTKIGVAFEREGRVPRKIKIGVITVLGPQYHPTRRLSEAAALRDCSLICIHPYKVWPGLLNGRPVLLERGRARDFQVVLPRQGAEIRDSCLPLLQHLELMGLKVINSLEAILKARNKFSTLQSLSAAGLPVAATFFVNSSSGFDEAIERLGGRAVAKPVSSRQGRGIRLVDAGKTIDPQLMAELDAGRGIVLQEYLSPRGRRDFRALVLGNKVIAAMELVAPKGDFRANFSLGGKPQPVDLRQKQVEKAVAAARALGLEIAGVDLVLTGQGRLVIGEVNYSPGFRGLEMVSGRDVAGAIIDYVMNSLDDNFKEQG